MDHYRQLPNIDKHQTDKFKTATFSMGCFWGPDAYFGVIPGVIRTRVGYAGGSSPHPTYQNIGDHIETIQIDFDPNVITFSELLTLFWENHSPNQQAFKRQYISALFFHDDQQKKLIEKSALAFRKKIHSEIFTEIMPFEKFHLAENYHQKYRLQQTPELKKIFEQIYPDINDFIHSTAAARVNGYVAGYGDLEQLKKEIDDLGLSIEIQKQLVAIVKQNI